MAQAEIIEYLKKQEGRFVSATELRKELNLSRGALHRNLLACSKCNDIVLKYVSSDKTKRRKWMYGVNT